MRLTPGSQQPLGATPRDGGVNFAVVSGVAECIELCLFDERGHEQRLALPGRTGNVWHGFAPGIGPRQRYGFRAVGPWDPARGACCSPRKLLLDPYARAIEGELSWRDAVFDSLPEARDAASLIDSAPAVPRSVVVDGSFDWRGDAAPRTPWSDTVVYEMHVEGFTARMTEVPPELRGTYAGLAHPAALAHLARLGVTAIELLPIQAFLHELHLVRLGLSNYWGYNPIAWLAPHPAYAAARDAHDAVAEVKQMVRALHAAGIEVLLDVVFNHTAEGDEQGPCLALRGLDDGAYYRRAASGEGRYADVSGCGNSVDLGSPAALELVMDALRYWVEEMHVDGFRFDLATALLRGKSGAPGESGFLEAVRTDPVLGAVKLIAEPWDLAPDGWRLGMFPAPWAEWNPLYRDAVRDFWRGRGAAAEFARRLTGSSDVFAPTGRGPLASINFVTAHDGFTLSDLVSYERKHNQANGEDNRDGSDDNRAWNCGVEGPSDDPEVLALRRLQSRNLLATLLLSQGIPMLLGGDEIGRSQRGNNNAYCQDNEISWHDWQRVDADRLAFVARLIALRRAHPSLRRAAFLRGDATPDAPPEAKWLRPDGDEMRNEDWHAPGARAFGLRLAAEPPDPALLLLVNGLAERSVFALPPPGAWSLELDTALDHAEGATATATLALAARSMALLSARG